jgi:hypothetical protein
MKKHKKYKKDNMHIQRSIEWYYFIPLALIGAFVPTIVYLDLSYVPEHIAKYWTGTENIDFFSFHKARWLIILTGTMILAALFTWLQESWEPRQNRIYIPMAIFAIMIILSTVFADALYRGVALYGFPDRYEGMYAWLSYLMITLLAMNLIQTKIHIKFIIGCLFGSAAFLSVIGLSQFFGYDLLLTDVATSLIYPGNYIAMAESIEVNFGKYTIYGTMYNSNYVGSYMAMLLVVSFTFYLFVHKWTHKISLGIITCLIFSNWIGCNSRAGIAAGVISIIVLLLLAHNRVLIQWKSALIITASFVLIFCTMNYFSNDRLLNQYKDLYSSSIINTAYADELQQPKIVSFQNLHLESNKAIIDMHDQILTIELSNFSKDNIQYKNNDFLFYDTQGNEIETRYNQESYNIELLNEQYKSYSVTLVNNLMTVNYGRLSIKLGIKDGMFYFINQSGEFILLQDIPAFGFEGKENIGSKRGYIWSRSLPMLKETIIFGNGPDTYSIYFPQHDYVGKRKFFGDFYFVIDKPHNMYLQIGINTGVVSLISFVIMLIMYIRSCFKIYFKAHNNLNIYFVTGIASFVGVISYATSGLFNDSVVSVSPVFWLLFGIGLACNHHITRILHYKK